MVQYRPADTLAHRFDPRAKLLVQAAFAVAVFLRSDPAWLLGFAALAGLALAIARCSPLAVLWRFRFPLALLALAPVVASLSFRPPGLTPAAAVEPTLAGSRVVLVLFVSAAYTRTTALRESRAAIQRLVPGRTGVLLGVGVELTIRLLPVLERDFRRLRDAEAARLGDRRSTVARIRTLGVGGVERALARADRLAVALRARCFAWNPTLPALSFARRDVPLLLLAAALLASLAF